jgi:phosphoadenosine phosphosulfate reductase
MATSPLDYSVFRRWNAEHPTERVIVWTSGGKDSFAVLALAARELGPDRIVPVFRYLVKGMRCVETPIRAQLRLLKIEHPLVEIPSMDALEYLRNGTYTTPQVAKKTRKVKFADVENLARKKTGAVWTAGGEKKQDTVHRQLWLRPFEGIDQRGRRLYPVHNWTHKQVRALVQSMRAPLCPSFGGENTTGLGFHVLEELKAKYPDDYERFIRAFPLAEARRLRDRIYGAPPRSAAEARAQARRAAGASERPDALPDGGGGDDPPDADQAGGVQPAADDEGRGAPAAE